jgi:hypothetical protein
MKLPWFKFEATAWLADPHVRLMTSRQRGWYIDLLCWAWQEGGFSKGAAEVICQALRDRSGENPEEIRAELEEVLTHFTLDCGGDRISHPKLERQRQVVLREYAGKSRGGETRASTATRSAGRFTATSTPTRTPGDELPDRHKTTRTPGGDPQSTSTPTRTPPAPPPGVHQHPYQDSSSYARSYSLSSSNTEIPSIENEKEKEKEKGNLNSTNGIELNWVFLLEELEGIYKQAGVPIPPQQRNLALQLILSLDDPAKTRVSERLPNFCKWALATGRWPSPAKTKSLVNVLRDGDWDVELIPRTVPVMAEESAKQRALREAEERILRRHHEWGKS